MCSKNLKTSYEKLWNNNQFFHQFPVLRFWPKIGCFERIWARALRHRCAHAHSKGFQQSCARERNVRSGQQWFFLHIFIFGTIQLSAKPTQRCWLKYQQHQSTVRKCDCKSFPRAQISIFKNSITGLDYRRIRFVNWHLPFMVAWVGAGMSGRQSSKSRYTKENPFCLTATTETIATEILIKKRITTLSRNVDLFCWNSQAHLLFCCFYSQVALSISKHAILLFTPFFLQRSISLMSGTEPRQFCRVIHESA